MLVDEMPSAAPAQADAVRRATKGQPTFDSSSPRRLDSLLGLQGVLKATDVSPQPVSLGFELCDSLAQPTVLDERAGGVGGIDVTRGALALA